MAGGWAQVSREAAAARDYYARFRGAGGIKRGCFLPCNGGSRRRANRHISHSSLRCGADTRVCRVETRHAFAVVTKCPSQASARVPTPGVCTFPKPGGRNILAHGASRGEEPVAPSPGTGRKAVLSPRGRAYRIRCHASLGMTGILPGTTLGDGAFVAPRCSPPHQPLGRRSR